KTGHDGPESSVTFAGIRTLGSYAENRPMFVISKLLSAITQPVFWLALWWALALLMLARWRRTATLMLWTGLAVLGLLGFRALPDALLRPLENRYPVPSAEAVGRHVGVIVLGGAVGHPDSYTAHGQVPLGDAAERMTVPVGLLRQHPKLELVFSGGEGRLLTTGVTEAELARAFYQQQGLDMTRVQLESGSRSTRENAQQVARLLGDRCKQPWLLVTSAWHMPRSMDEFEAEFGKRGCKITPYPVDFMTGTSTAVTEYELAASLVRWQTALHEWLGIWAYRLTR
ncbi:MAG: YdcF family protein, partial [Betaproteobacteria bacterium]